MNNDKNMLRHTVTVCLLAMLVAVSHIVLADELGMVAGGLDGYLGLALNYQSAALWQGTLVTRPLDVSLEYSLGRVQAPAGQSNRNLAHIGLTPFARWWLTSNTGAELGVGANVFSGTRLGDKNISTAFQFGSSLGLFHRLEHSPWLFGLRLTHYSNAGIKEPNSGQNYVQLRASYVFP
jgi:lipid A 3-O-deacylase